MRVLTTTQGITHTPPETFNCWEQSIFVAGSSSKLAGALLDPSLKHKPTLGLTLTPPSGLTVGFL